MTRPSKRQTAAPGPESDPRFWRSRGFYLAVNWLLGSLLGLWIFGGLMFAFLPFSITFCAGSGLLAFLVILLRSRSGGRSVNPARRKCEQAIRADFRGPRKLLSDISETFFLDDPRPLTEPWRINTIEYRGRYSVLDMEPERAGANLRLRLVLDFARDGMQVVAAYRHDHATAQWRLEFGEEPASDAAAERRRGGLGVEDALPLLIMLVVIIPLMLVFITAPNRAVLLWLGETVFGMPLRTGRMEGWTTDFLFLGETRIPLAFEIVYPFDSAFGTVLQPAHMELAGGALGVVIALLLLWDVGAWQLRVARQMRNLPTATTRSAAIGLAELRGVARGPKNILHFGSDDTAEGTLHFTRSFFLEDSGGRIRIDPGNAQIRSYWSSHLTQRIGAQIVLTGRVQERAFGRKEKRTLRDGDPIYVLGAVEIDGDAPQDAADSGLLVVRRSHRRVALPWFYSLLRIGHSPEQFTDLDVFFISDMPEKGAHDWIMDDFRKTLAWGLFWTVSCAWLFLHGGRGLGLW